MSLNIRVSARNWSLIRGRLTLTTRCLLLLGVAQVAGVQAAEDVEFNPAFFPDGAGGLQVDVSKFSRGNIVLPGSYRAEVYLTPNAARDPEVTAADLKLALAEMEQFYDVAPNELEQLINTAQIHARRRSIGEVLASRVP